VSDKIAFGFAASNKPQLPCGCYKLDFTSTAIAGKSMVVQVVNTGGIAGNQFDLFIPGGGVGDLNACSDQYGAPSDGWGISYGGILEEKGCESINEDDRKEGCKFRFGSFFKGADNPNMKFQRVKCPSWHTDTTGCKRNDE
jgi:hypothetical protein